jgi:hypothetical protein
MFRVVFYKKKEFDDFLESHVQHVQLPVSKKQMATATKKAIGKAFLANSFQFISSFYDPD